jgi:hypothetical protein
MADLCDIMTDMSGIARISGNIFRYCLSQRRSEYFFASRKTAYFLPSPSPEHSGDFPSLQACREGIKGWVILFIFPKVIYSLNFTYLSNSRLHTHKNPSCQTWLQRERSQYSGCHLQPPG